jgi:flagellar basal-body rod modification protein FlgD
MNIQTQLAGTGSTGMAQKDTNPSGGSTIDYNAFLQLLVTEMKNQDPSNPMDPTQSVAQFAAFANVEQGIQTNTKLEAMLTSSALSQADGVIGHKVTSADGKTSGTVVSLTIGSAGAVTATLNTGADLVLGEGTVVS